MDKRAEDIATFLQGIDDMANLTQEFNGCTVVYDLTGHRLTVAQGDKLLLKLWSLPDTPGGFDLNCDGHYIEVHNPVGVDFVPVPDNTAPDEVERVDEDS